MAYFSGSVLLSGASRVPDIWISEVLKNSLLFLFIYLFKCFWQIYLFIYFSYSYIVFSSVMAFLFLKGSIKQYIVECTFGGHREQNSNLHAQVRLEVRILEEDGLKG